MIAYFELTYSFYIQSTRRIYTAIGMFVIPFL